MVVVGGGNSAVADALLLSRIAQKVILVHRRDSLRAEKIYHEQLMHTANVEFRWNSTVTELLHDERLTGVRLKDTVTGEESTLACDGVFVSVGRKPATELVTGQLTAISQQVKARKPAFRASMPSATSGRKPFARSSPRWPTVPSPYTWRKPI